MSEDEHRIAGEQTGAAISHELLKMHPGNRFRLMLGLPLLPEPNSVVDESELDG